MGRIEKQKREMIMEANMRLLNESDISIAEPEMDTNTMSPISAGEGLSLECVKIDYENPENSEVGNSGPYPWSLVQYDKNNRPVKLFVFREGKPRDVVWGGSNDYEMVIGFTEITDPSLKSLLGVNKKYIMSTDKSPGLVGKQFCKVDGKMDKEWDNNLFSLGRNSNLIEPYPDFSKITG